MITFQINVLPPSVNHMYGRKGSHTFKTKEAEDFAETAYYELVMTRPKEPLVVPCKLDLTFTFVNRRSFVMSDIDNKLKCVCDALQSASYILNDHLIHEITARKILGDKDGISGILETYVHDLSAATPRLPRTKVRREPSVLQPGDRPDDL